MKHLKFTLLIGLLSILIAPTLVAQNIDANRMNRDIRIMENILGELFRTRLGTSNATAEAIFFSNGVMQHRGIRGTYLQDYGLIFMVEKNTNVLRPSLRVQGQNGYSFYYSNDGDNSSEYQVDESSIRERITEFLMDYGSTIGQLDDDDNIMVIYDPSGNSGRTALVGYVRTAGSGSLSSKTETETELLPVISGSVIVKDLKDYRSGRINEGDIKQRITFANNEDKQFMDLEILSNIFENALSERVNDTYRTAGGVSYMMLDNFGSIFTMNVRFTEQNSRWRNSIEREFARVQYGFDNDVEQEEYDKYLEKVEKAFDQLKVNISEYLVDYGRTLSSVSTDQNVLVTVTVLGRLDEIPERVDFQIKKSVLESMDRGRISREDAINAVSITEY